MRNVGEAGPGRRTRLSAAERRESILNAAIEVFTAAGYRAGKVSDVAAKVGVTEPVVFQNFGSKAALFAAVLDRIAGDIRDELQALTRHHGSVPGLLAHVLGPPNAGKRHGPGSHRVLFTEAASLAAEPGLPEPAQNAARAIARHLADLIRHGQLGGDIRADVDPEAAAWLLLSVLSSQPLRAAAMPDADRLEAGVAALALQALTSPTRAEPPADDQEKHGPSRHG